MVWCSYCSKDQIAERDDINGFTFCLGTMPMVHGTLWFRDGYIIQPPSPMWRNRSPPFQASAARYQPLWVGGYNALYPWFHCCSTLLRTALMMFYAIYKCCCTGCGRVLDDNNYSSDVQFAKSASGQSHVVGNFIREGQYSTYSRLGNGSGTLSGYQSASHERTLDKGRQEIRDMADWLSMGGRDDTTSAAHRLYVLAVEKNFTRGRRTQQVAAACLYIVCRQDSKPYLLIDFSDYLQTNVYVLGAVFLQLCRLLRLDQHPIMQKPVDPSLFIHRFTDRLLSRSGESGGRKHHSIANTALRLVASMKRDWIQTGRRPSGVCGAALYLSALIHGFECTKSDVISVVHICESTLRKRLVEFENTESGSLTAEEFESKAKELELQVQSVADPYVNVGPRGERAITEILCEHKSVGAVHYAHGLCRSCYDDFIKVSGGIQGGAEPPAFQRAEKERRKRERMMESQLLSYDELWEEEAQPREGEISQGKRFLSSRVDKHVPGDNEVLATYANKRSKNDPQLCHGKQPTDVTESLQEHSTKEKDCSMSCNDTTDSCTTECTKSSHVLDNNVGSDDYLDEEPGTLSDIDDNEVVGYLNNDEEIRLKTIVWTEMNKEYLEEQEAKEAAIGSDSATAAELAAAAIAARKIRKPRCSDNGKKEPAETPAEATRQMLERKKLSSKLNYSVLEEMFDGMEQSPKPAEEPRELDSTTKSPLSVHWADQESLPKALGSSNKVEDAIKEDCNEDLEDDYGDEDGTVADDVQVPAYSLYEQVMKNIDLGILLLNAWKAWQCKILYK